MHCLAIRMMSLSILVMGLWALLAVLWWLSQRLGGADDRTVLLIAGVLTLPMTLLLFQRRRVRRQGWLAVFLAVHSPWQSRLRGGIMMATGQVFLSSLLAFLLVTGLARTLESNFWFFLMFLMPFWVTVHFFLESTTEKHVHIRYRRIVADRLVSILFGIVLLTFLLLGSLQQPLPRLDGVALEAAILTYLNEVDVVSPVLEVGLSIHAISQAFVHWLVQNLGPHFEVFLVHILLWFWVLLKEWLFVWPLLILLQAMHGLLDGSLLRGYGGSFDHEGNGSSG